MSEGEIKNMLHLLRSPWGHGEPQLRQSRHDAADEIERLRAVLERIGAMDPATDSIEGYNECGEADCFHQAQSDALLALGPNAKLTVPWPQRKQK